jgi:hypothetical protein
MGDLRQHAGGHVGNSEDERDAVLAAFAARAMVAREPGWYDLVAIEDDQVFFPAGHASYWFPLEDMGET